MRTVIGSLAGAGYAVAKGFLHRLGDLACVLPGALGDVSNLVVGECLVGVWEGLLCII